MDNWFSYLKKGLSRDATADSISHKPNLSNNKQNINKLKPFLLKHWKKGLIGAFLVIFTSFLAFPLPIINKYMIDDVILKRRLNLLAGTLILIVVIKGLSYFFNFLQQFYFTHFQQEVLMDIQKELIEHTLRLPKSFFDKKDTGYLLSRISSDVQGLSWFFSNTIISIISNTLRLIGGIIFLLYLEWKLSLLILSVLPGMLLLIRYFSKKIRILSHHTMEQSAKLSSKLHESLSTPLLIKSFTSESSTVKEVVSEIKKQFQLSLERVTVTSTANLFANFMPDIARGITFAVGAYWIIKGQWTLGSLWAFQAYIGYVYGPVTFLSHANFQLQNALVALQRVSAIFNIVPEDTKGGIYIDKLKGDIEFKNVYFSYNGTDLVLKDISFHVEPGDHVAIVGPSGVGKTTLISLILRLYKPTSGEIYFDGVPASKYNLNALRKRIGYVAQITQLVSKTILENLMYGNPEAKMEEVENAARIAGIHDFIKSLPKGYETLIGENGIKLSEGQSQRLAIARALIKNPDILIMDEPSSALDVSTEQSIFTELPKLLREKTLFIVAHRPSTIKSAKHVILLNEKRIIAFGTHNELLKSNEYFRSIMLKNSSTNETC